MLRSHTLVVAAAGCLCAAPAAAEEPGTTVIESDYGSITVMGLFQTLFTARFDNSDIDRNEDGEIDDVDDARRNDHYDFSLQRARIVLKGHLLSPNLTYAFQGDATVDPFVLDTKLGYVIPEDEGYSTTIMVGRTLPPFTLVLPRLVTRLDAINYPLYLFCPLPEPQQPFASTNTVGRQVGLVLTQKLASMITIDVGVFNGFQREPVAAGWGDDNDLKDFMARLAVTPIDGLQFAGDFWAGFPVSLDAAEEPFPVAADDAAWQNDTALFGVFEFELTALDPFKAMGEFVASHQTTRTRADPTSAQTETDTTGLGGWFHVSYTFKSLFGSGGHLEAMARFDYYDLDIDLADTTLMRVTVGPQFFLEGIHSQIRLNYILNLADPAVFGDPDESRLTRIEQGHEVWLQAAVEL